MYCVLFLQWSVQHYKLYVNCSTINFIQQNKEHTAEWGLKIQQLIHKIINVHYITQAVIPGYRVQYSNMSEKFTFGTYKNDKN